jgi:CrcB protein
MVNLLFVGAGGFFGSISRYLISGWVQNALPYSRFPYGTLTVNFFGCLFIGLFAGMAESRNLFGPEARLFLFIGFLGGFTTFSTFGHETMALLRGAEMLKAFANIFFSVTICLIAVWLGNLLSRYL